jgi:hypothetical protein
MLRVKPGVSLSKLVPQMVLAAVVVDQEYAKLGVDCWITSGDDGEHRTGSLHYVGKALDFRTRHIEPPLVTDPSMANINLAFRIQERLGAQFRVAFETSTTTRTEHVHAEFLG